MSKQLRIYTAYLLIMVMIAMLLPTYAFGAEIPSGYKESTKAGSKISTDVYLTTHETTGTEKPDPTDPVNPGKPDNSIKYTVEYYFQNIENDNYTQDVGETKQLTGKENDVVTIDKENASRFSGFIFNEKLGVLSGQLSSKSDLILKAYYDRNLITVNVDPDNEAGNKDKMVIKYGSMIKKPAPQKDKDGYKFNGWIDESGVHVDFTKPFVKDTTIRPAWLPDTSSGEGDNAGNKPSGGNTGEGGNIDNNKYKYIIKYWFNDELEQKDGSGKIGERIPYNLTSPFKHNGLNYILESFKVTKFITNDEDKNIAEVFYTLDEKDRDGNKIPNGDGIPDNYQTPNDKYTTDDSFGYKVSYNYKEETELISSVMKTGQGTVGSVIPYSYANTVDKDGHTFNLESLVVNSNIITPNEADNIVEVNYLLTDNKQPETDDTIQYMVSADPDNGSPIKTYFVKEGNKLPDLGNPTKVGCEFIGWIDNSGNIVNIVNNDTIVKSNMALKAVWKLKDTAAEYTISHYKPAKADESQEFTGFELVTVDKCIGEIGSTVQAKTKNWDGYKVDTSNKNTVISGVISDDSKLELRVFYIADSSNSGNTPSGGSSESGSSGSSGGSGGGHGGGRPSHGNKPAKPSDANNNNTISSNSNNKPESFEMMVGLDKTNHIAYIKGYIDSTMQPNGNITRGEVAEIVYRLMTDEYRDVHYTTENSFIDVNKDIWCNVSISTDAQAGVLKGYEDGEFKFNNSITRAEFATIVSRFFNIDENRQSDLTDIHGHWAEDAINKVAIVGWVKGYADKTFRPNDCITRAEAVTIFNSILDRNVKEMGLIEERKEWPDVDKASWYYLDIQEAANTHTYTRDSNYNELWQSVVE